MTECTPTPDTAERYVAGTMPEPERTSFEDHFMACEACFEIVQALQDAGAVLAAGSRNAVGVGAQPRRSFPYKWMAVAATVIVSVVVWNVSIREEEDTPSRGSAINDARAPDDIRPAAPAPAASSPAPAVPATTPPTPVAPQQPGQGRLEQWATVKPPQYVALPTRSAPDPADKESQPFSEAMAHYSAGRYRQAADRLGALAEQAPDAAHVHFFLGISELMSDNVSRARGALQRSAESGVSPYSDEAHFYLAKVAIRTGDLTTAARELKIAVERDAGPDGDAARLLAELRRAKQ